MVKIAGIYYYTSEMNLHEYSSPSPIKAQDESENKSLAVRTFEFFRRFIHPLQYALGDPRHSPPKFAITKALANKGVKGCCKYVHKGRECTLRYLQDWQFAKSIEQHERLYYVSGIQNVLLLYHDIDIHKKYQTDDDARQGQAIVADICRKFAIWQDSARGNCGWSIIDCSRTPFAESEAHLKRFEKCVRKLFAKAQCKADYEIKGLNANKLDGEHQWKQYGKLPTYKDWTEEKLDEFKRLPHVSIKRIVRWCDAVDAAIDDSVLDNWEAYKKHTAKSEVVLAAEALKKCGSTQTVQDSLAPLVNPANTTAKAVELCSRAPHVSHPEVDSFAVQRTALLKLCRQRRRVVSVEEAMDHTKANRLYTGDWADDARRKKRVPEILRYIAQTFDTTKCGSGKKINLGKWDDWCRRRYPNGITHCRTLRNMTEDGEIIERHTKCEVELDFIQVFVPVVEFIMLTDGKADGGVPQDRAAALWKKLQENGQVTVEFDHRKWSACREVFAKQRIVCITDRKYHPGKAMCWAADQHFPKDKPVRKARPIPSDVLREYVGDAVPLATFLERTQNQSGHNVCLTAAGYELFQILRSVEPRPPP